MIDSIEYRMRTAYTVLWFSEFQVVAYFVCQYNDFTNSHIVDGSHSLKTKEKIYIDSETEPGEFKDFESGTCLANVVKTCSSILESILTHTYIDTYSDRVIFDDRFIVTFLWFIFFCSFVPSTKCVLCKEFFLIYYLILQFEMVWEFIISFFALPFSHMCVYTVCVQVYLYEFVFDSN